jgi:hypothetical protein
MTDQTNDPFDLLLDEEWDVELAITETSAIRTRSWLGCTAPLARRQCAPLGRAGPCRASPRLRAAAPTSLARHLGDREW